MRIGHRCGCGHGDTNHRTQQSGKRECTSSPCTRRCRREETSELLPTFDAKGHAVERIVEPGQKLGTTEGESNATTCGCDACRALYTELTGIELEPVPA